MKSTIIEASSNGSKSLSVRELEVLKVVAMGYPGKEVADILYVSKRTVDFHLVSVFRKLGVNNRMLAVHTARDLGLIARP